MAAPFLIIVTLIEHVIAKPVCTLAVAIRSPTVLGVFCRKHALRERIPTALRTSE